MKNADRIIMFSFLKGNIRVITISRILGRFTRSMIFPYASLYILALGGNTANVGFVSSIGSLASLLIFPIAGLFADRGGRVKLIVISGFLGAFSLLFNIFANSWLMIALGSFISGMLVFQFPAISALVADSLPPNRRGIGFATISAIPNGLAVVAPFIAGYILDEVGVDPAMRYLYTVAFASYIVVALIQMRFLKETVEGRNDFLSSDFKTIITESFQNVLTVIKWMPRSLRVLATILALNFLANAFAAPFWIIYGIQVIGLSASDWGLLTLLSSAFTIVVSIPAGAAIDRFGRRKTLIASFMLTFTAILSFIYARGFIDILMILLALSTANAFMNPACEAFLADIVPKEMRGRVMAALGRGQLMISPGRGGGGGPGMGYLFAIPVMLGSLIGGFIYGVNPALPWILQSIIILVILLISFPFLREPEVAEA